LPKSDGEPNAETAPARTERDGTALGDSAPAMRPSQISQACAGRVDDRAQVALQMLGREWDVSVGLRGQPIVSSSTPTGSPAAVVGRWASEREFILDLDTVAEVNHFIFRLTFRRDELRILVDEVTGELKGLPIRARRDRTSR
jgi:hypothetical protein